MPKNAQNKRNHEQTSVAVCGFLLGRGSFASNHQLLHLESPELKGACFVSTNTPPSLILSRASKAPAENRLPHLLHFSLNKRDLRLSIRPNTAHGCLNACVLQWFGSFSFCHSLGQPKTSASHPHPEPVLMPLVEQMKRLFFLRTKQGFFSCSSFCLPAI